MTRDVTFDESTLYYQLLKLQQHTNVILEPAKPPNNHPCVQQQSLQKLTVQRPKRDPIDDYEDGYLTAPLETPESSETSGPSELTS
jgi:hypothetical protein